MSYTVSSSEKLRKKGADTETKALLHLMVHGPNNDDIYYFVVDFFNDLTGLNKDATELWDVQSKGTKNATATAIGRELVTLFKNYVSQIKFHHYILFIDSVADTLRKDNNNLMFGVSNIKPKQLEKIKIGLIDECKSKEYVDDIKITNKNIDDFLREVIFVVGNGKDGGAYVLDVIKHHTTLTPTEEVLQAIFNEIRNVQSNKKNQNVEGVVIDRPDETLNYGRHLTYNEIYLLILQRILTYNPLDKRAPLSFVEEIKHCPPEEKRRLIEGCQASIARVLFDKNSSEGFWNLFNIIVRIVNDKKYNSISKIYLELHKIIKWNECCPQFDALSLKYFIALVKDGVDNYED